MAIRFACMGCGKTVKAPDVAAGRRAKCPGCGAVQIVPAASTAELDPLGLQQGAVSAPAAPRANASASPGEGACPGCGAVLREGAPLCKYCGWVNPAGMARPVPAQGVAGPQRGFAADVTRSFAFHFSGRGAWVFGVTVIMMTLGPIIAQFGMAGFFGWLTIEGVYCALLLETILDTCAGEDELPALELGGGFWEGVFRPIFLFLGGTLVAAWPLLAWLVAAELEASGPMGSPAVGVALLALGVLLWPMTMLTIAINGFSPGHLRYDKQIVTIARAPGPYLAICAVLALVVAMSYGADRLAEGLLDAGADRPGPIILRAMAVLFISAVVQVYTAFAAMRIIGLFYRHYKARFAWLAE